MKEISKDKKCTTCTHCKDIRIFLNGDFMGANCEEHNSIIIDDSQVCSSYTRDDYKSYWDNISRIKKMPEEQTTGYKNDVKESRKDDVKDNKPMWQLFPFAELSGVVNVYTAGAKKYGENRWQNLEDGEHRYFGAFCRHWVEHLRGNEIDPEDGCLHLDKCIWNLIAVRHCFLESKGIDANTTNYDKL